MNSLIKQLTQKGNVLQSFDDFNPCTRNTKRSVLHDNHATKRLIKTVSSLFERASFGFLVTKNCHIQSCNESFAHLLGFSSEELKDKLFEDVVYHQDYERGIELIGQICNQEEQNLEIRQRFRRKDSSMFWGKTLVTLVEESTGFSPYKLIIVENIQKEVEEEQRKLSLISVLQSQVDELNDFAFTVSHDLKSPLRAATNLLGWLKEDLDSELSETSEEYLKELEVRLNRMYSLIEGILDYSNFEQNSTGTMEIDTKKVIQYVFNFVEVNKPLQVNYYGDFPKLNMSEMKLQQVFQNLIVNAIKYNKNAICELSIKAFEDDLNYHISISDNGIGIPKNKFDHIFQIFSSLNQDKESTGIGLTIVKKIMDQIGGSISVESELGMGSTFTVSFRKDKVSPTFQLEHHYN